MQIRGDFVENPLLGGVFFVTFVIFVVLILLNMFIAVLLLALDQVLKGEVRKSHRKTVVMALVHFGKPRFVNHVLLVSNALKGP